MPEMKSILVCIGVAVFHLGQATLAEMTSNNDFRNKISEVQNISQWCQLLKIDDCEKVINSTPTSMIDEIGNELEILGNKDTPVALYDRCTPRLQTVKIPERPGYTVWPPCTRAFRCAGCCTTSRYSCQPVTTTEIFVKIYYAKIQNHDQLENSAHPEIETTIMKIDEHVQCGPACKTKKEDCKKSQKYDPDKCLCVCRPPRKCDGKHVWDEETCSCACPNKDTTVCPLPSFFSQSACKCKLKSGAKRNTYKVQQSTDHTDADMTGADVKLIEENIVTVDVLRAVLGEGRQMKTDSKKETGHGRFDDDDDDVDDDVDVDEITAAEGQQTPVFLKDSCFDVTCSGGLKPRKHRSGKCQCLPARRGKVLTFERQNL